MKDYHSNSKLVFLGIALTAIIINADLSITNLALARIGKVFHASLTTLQWIIVVYILFGVAFQVFAGRLADSVGKKKVYLFGVSLFIVASLICALSPNSVVLIVGRALQGLAFALTLALGMIIATFVFPDEKRGRILGIYAMVAGFSQAVGPVIGGMILQFLSWRWIFLINLPLGIGSLLLISFFFSEHEFVPKKSKLDVVGITFLLIGLMLITLAFNEMNRWQLYSWPWLGSIVFGLLSLVLFYYHEKRTKNPLLDFSLFSNHNFTLISIIRFVNNYISFAVIFIVPLFLQNILGLSPFKTGAIIFSCTACYAITSPFAGRIIDRIGPKKPIIVSIFIGLVAAAILAFTRLNLSWVLFIFSLVLVGINKAIMLPSSVNVVMSNVQKEKVGMGMGAFYTINLSGGIMGIALTGLMIGIFSQNKITCLLKSMSTKITPQQLMHLKQVGSGALPLHALVHSLPTKIMHIVPLIQQAFLSGFRATMWIVVILSIVSLGLSFYLVEECK